MTVGQMLHSMEHPDTLNRHDTRPRRDLVFGARRRVLFAHGCCGHDHHDCRERRLPTSRVVAWSDKVTKNKARDVRTVRGVEDPGWRVCMVRECGTPVLDSITQSLVRFLDGGSR